MNNYDIALYEGTKLDTARLKHLTNSNKRDMAVTKFAQNHDKALKRTSIGGGAVGATGAITATAAGIKAAQLKKKADATEDPAEKAKLMAQYNKFKKIAIAGGATATAGAAVSGGSYALRKRSDQGKLNTRVAKRTKKFEDISNKNPEAFDKYTDYELKKANKDLNEEAEIWNEGYCDALAFIESQLYEDAYLEGYCDALIG